MSISSALVLISTCCCPTAQNFHTTELVTPQELQTLAGRVAMFMGCRRNYTTGSPEISPAFLLPLGDQFNHGRPVCKLWHVVQVRVCDGLYGPKAAGKDGRVFFSIRTDTHWEIFHNMIRHKNKLVS